MSIYFSLNEIRSKRQYASYYSKRFDRLEMIRLNNLKELIGRLPEENELMFIETKKSFNAFTFIVFVIKSVGNINDLFIATYSINQRIMNALCRYQDKGQIKRINIEISASIRFRSPKIYEQLKRFTTERDWKISYAWTHRKISCMATDDGHFVAEGSGNFGENSLIEQYIFTKSSQLYAFRNHRAGDME